MFVRKHFKIKISSFFCSQKIHLQSWKPIAFRRWPREPRDSPTRSLDPLESLSHALRTRNCNVLKHSFSLSPNIQLAILNHLQHIGKNSGNDLQNTKTLETTFQNTQALETTFQEWIVRHYWKVHKNAFQMYGLQLYRLRSRFVGGVWTRCNLSVF